VLELSRSIEIKLDEEWKDKRIKNKKNNNNNKDIINENSLIAGELELGGRRLVIMEALSKNKAGQ